MTRHAQQDSRPQCGWLWRRLPTSSRSITTGEERFYWERFFCRGSSKRLSLFADEKEEDLVDVIPLSQVSLSEVTFQDAFQPGCSRRHSRGLLLRVAQAASLADELSSETESLLHGRLGGTLLAPRQEVLLAAEDAQQHAAWLKRIGKSCANKARLLEDGSESKQTRLYSTGIRSPPQAVVQRLCGPGLLRGRQLMERLRYMRWQLEAGLRDLSSVREEARSAQRPINDLHGILLDMSQALDLHHGDVTHEPDVAALRLCQDWLQGAITFVMEVDHHIEQLVFAEPGSNVAAEWVPLAHNTVLQLRDIEDAMRAEDLRQLQQRRLQQHGPAGGGGCCCRSYVTSPAMPYARWWAGKVAL